MLASIVVWNGKDIIALSILGLMLAAVILVWLYYVVVNCIDRVIRKFKSKR